MVKNEKQKKLGRGMNALLGAGKSLGAPASAPASVPSVIAGEPLLIPIHEIDPNPRQPRTHFNEDKLQELADSIKSQGVLQPVIVRKHGARYELIAGERRLRASKLAQCPTIPAIVQKIADDRMLAAALVENIQRDDLNALEVAHAYQLMMDELHLTHDEIAMQVGTSRVNVTNTLRLLKASANVQECLLRGTISAGHARALSALDDTSLQDEYLRDILSRNLSVRQIESMLRDRAAGRTPAVPADISMAGSDAESATTETSPAPRKPAIILDYEEQLRGKFGTRCTVTDHGGKGHVTIEYYSNEDFGRILAILGLGDRVG